MALLLALQLFSSSAHASWWSNFCEKYLISDEPDQYRDCTVDQLVGVYWMFRNHGDRSRPLMAEMWKRLSSDGLSDEDREILVKTLNNEERE